MPELEVGVLDSDQGKSLDEAAPDGAGNGGRGQEDTEPGTGDPGAAGLSAPAPPAAVPGEPGDAAATTALAEIVGSISRLTVSAEQYHERARQREGVIDYLRDELDLLRRGERRSLQRPLLATLSRLHGDLLLQARSLRDDYTVEQARELLKSFAGTVETALADAGISPYTPEPGEPFDPRRHRKIKTENTLDPTLDGLVAAVRKPGYSDIEADSLLAPAEVALYKAVKDEQ